MCRFHCPECGVETEVSPAHGGEIVSAYCLRHKTGVDGHTRPVHMTQVPATVTVVQREPALV